MLPSAYFKRWIHTHKICLPSIPCSPLSCRSGSGVGRVKFSRILSAYHLAWQDWARGEPRGPTAFLDRTFREGPTCCYFGTAVRVCAAWALGSAANQHARHAAVRRPASRAGRVERWIRAGETNERTKRTNERTNASWLLAQSGILASSGETCLTGLLAAGVVAVWLASRHSQYIRTALAARQKRKKKRKKKHGLGPGPGCCCGRPALGFGDWSAVDEMKRIGNGTNNICQDGRLCFVTTYAIFDEHRPEQL